MDRNWKVKKISYEGFPLIVRYPGQQSAPPTRLEFPSLAVITHHFSKRRNNGLPEPDYNETLFEFDERIRESFESKDMGVTVLIETYAAKRNYYIYTVTDSDITSILADTLNQFSEHKITWLTRSDPNWNFIDK